MMLFHVKHPIRIAAIAAALLLMAGCGETISDKTTTGPGPNDATSEFHLCLFGCPTTAALRTQAAAIKSTVALLKSETKRLDIESDTLDADSVSREQNIEGRDSYSATVAKLKVAIIEKCLTPLRAVPPQPITDADLPLCDDGPAISTVLTAAEAARSEMQRAQDDGDNVAAEFHRRELATQRDLLAGLVNKHRI